MTHDIPPETLNSNINYCIDEYVRLVTHRDMLRDKWFNGYSFTELANKYQVSDQTVKNVIYGIGDDILIRASNMKSPAV
jgi:predicted DNA-binding protein YlxM (UPF0122 family)